METVASTVVSGVTGLAVGLFFVSNPLGWGTAVVLTMGSAYASWSAGQYALKGYSKWAIEVDFVAGIGLDKVCR